MANLIVNLLTIVTIVVLIISGSSSFQVLVYTPSAVERGSQATLICISDLYLENIYKVTWKKDDSKIYRYKPSDLDSEREIFRTPGLSINERSSNLTHLFLNSVDITTEGVYTCEVESRGPSFFTRRNSSELRVYSVPQTRDPILIEDPPNRSLKKMDLNCVSAPTYPETKLSWLINGRPADRSELSSSSVTTQSDLTKVSKLGLKYHARKEDLYPGFLNFTCTGLIQLKYADSTRDLGRFSSSLTIRPRDKIQDKAEYTHETMDYSDESVPASVREEVRPAPGYRPVGTKPLKSLSPSLTGNLVLIVLTYPMVILTVRTK